MSVVLVHGRCGRPDDWELVLRELAGREISCTTVDLPSCHSAGDLVADVKAVAAAIDEAAPPVVVCAAGYGGVPVTAAAGSASLARVVYLAGLLPVEGESATRLSSPAPAEPLDLRLLGDGTFLDQPVPLDDPDLESLGEQALAIASQPRRPQSVMSVVQRCPASLPDGVPATYVVTTRDPTIPVDLQERLAQRAAEVVRLDAGRWVTVTHAAAVAELLAPS